MDLSEVKIYTTFDSFEADQVAATLEYYGIIYQNTENGYSVIKCRQRVTHHVSISKV